MNTEEGSRMWGIGVAAVLLFGVWECVLGWGQLTGILRSHHPLYPATGSFFNPGPYCGFLGMLIPVALAAVIARRPRLLHWCGLVYLLLAVPLLPVLLGRTGWIAAIVGSLYVAIATGCLRRPSGKTVMIGVAAAVPLVAFLIWLKPLSALGRVFLWRVGLEALFSRPLTGWGWTAVGGALGAGQEAYFTAHPDSVFGTVAGTPEYAFNEFLQVGIAFGILPMILMVGVLTAAVIAGNRNRQYGLTGGVLSFITVCLSSYPLQFCEFVGAVALMLTGIFCFTPSLGKYLKVAVALLIWGVAVWGICGLRRYDRLSSEWGRLRNAYRYTLDARDVHALDSMSAVYGHSSAFLFDYGKALRASRMYARSSEILGRGVEVSSDPMFLNLLGRNCQDTGDYAGAEKYYRRALHRQPGRLYPCYLLLRLYADSAVMDTARFRALYPEAMAREPKVMSPAIRQMRDELRELARGLTDTAEDTLPAARAPYKQGTPHDEGLREQPPVAGVE